MSLKRRRRNVPPDDGESNPTQILALSLFIMLLAFFIVLNSMSSFDEGKVDPIVASVERAFGTDILQDQLPQPSVTQSEQKDLGEGSTLEKMEALFAGQIPSAEIVVNERRGMMQVRMSRIDFDQAVEDVGAGATDMLFFKQLISLIKNEREGAPYRMDVYYEFSEAPSALYVSSSEVMRDMTREASGAVASLETAGLPPYMQGVGFQKGEEDTVQLMFRPYTPFNPDAGIDPLAPPEGGGG